MSSVRISSSAELICRSSTESAERGDGDSRYGQTDGHGVKKAGMEGMISLVIDLKPVAKRDVWKIPVAKGRHVPRKLLGL